MSPLLNKLCCFAVLMICLPLAVATNLGANNAAIEEEDSMQEAKLSQNPQQAQLRQLLRSASHARTFTPATSAELKQIALVFQKLLQDGPSLSLQKQAQALQMEIINVGEWRVLQEQDNAQRGRGFYVFRSKAHQHILQVPHSFKDEMTRDIGLALFAEGPFAAVAFNTVPRRFNDAQGAEINADMAHLEGTYFLAFAKAAAAAHPTGKSLQIHGFSQAKRKTSLQAEADIILSAGHKQPPASLHAGQQKLARSLQRNINLYADNLKELGATTNVQAQALRAQGYQGFIHVEMSRAMRQSMRSDASARGHLLQSLLGPA